MCKDYTAFLKHIRDSLQYIARVLPSSFEEFNQDDTVRFAIVKNLEIIGEATRHIPADVKVKWRDIEWKQMAGMRNKLTHEYWGVDYYIVWQVASEIAPRILVQILEVIDKDEKDRNNTDN